MTNSHASPTPVIEEGRVYVHFGSYGTACLDTQDGRILWQRRDFPCNHWRGSGSSPILFEDLLIVHFDGYDYQYVVAMDKQTGHTRWKIDRNIDYETDDGDLKKAFCTPTVITVDGQAQLISPAARAAIAYNPRTGDEIWRIGYPNHSATARPLFGHGLLFINSGFSKGQLYAVRPEGRGDITDTNIVWTEDRSIGSKPSHLLVDDLLYIVHDGGAATVLEARHGPARLAQTAGWTFRLTNLRRRSPLLHERGRDDQHHQTGREFRRRPDAVETNDVGRPPAVVDHDVDMHKIPSLFGFQLKPVGEALREKAPGLAPEVVAVSPVAALEKPSRGAYSGDDPGATTGRSRDPQSLLYLACPEKESSRSFREVIRLCRLAVLGRRRFL